MANNKITQTSDLRDRFAVLVDVGCDWPEVIFVGDYDCAALIAQLIPDDALHTERPRACIEVRCGG